MKEICVADYRPLGLDKVTVDFYIDGKKVSPMQWKKSKEKNVTTSEMSDAALQHFVTTTLNKRQLRDRADYNLWRSRRTEPPTPRQSIRFLQVTPPWEND